MCRSPLKTFSAFPLSNFNITQFLQKNFSRNNRLNVESHDRTHAHTRTCLQNISIHTRACSVNYCINTRANHERLRRKKWMKLFGRKGRLQAEDGGFGAAFDASNNISSSEPQGQERQDQHQHQHQHEQHQQQHQHQQEDEDEDSDNGGGAREERLPTIDLQRSRGFSNADMDADMVSILYQQQQLRVERQLSLPDQHPRSNSQESYGQTDQEDAESEDMGSRSDRHSSIE